MKKIIKLLLLFVVSLLFAACDNKWDLDWEVTDRGKVCHDEIVLTGELYELNSTWYLRTDMREAKGFEFGFEEGWEIQIDETSLEISLANMEGIKKTFKGILEFQKVTGPDGGESIETGSLYHYLFHIVDVK